MFGERCMDIEAEVVDPTEVDMPFVTTNAQQIMNETAKFYSTNCSTNLTLCNNCTNISSVKYIISIVVPIFYAIIVVVGLIGNTLVVLVVASNPQMLSTTNVLIINLAAADLLFLLFCVPFTAHHAIASWPFGEIWCGVVQYLVIVCAYASIYTLVLMSLDRFLAVVHPITSVSIRTVRNAWIACGIMWAVIVIACIPTLQLYGQVHYSIQEEEFLVCAFLLSKGYNYAAFRISFFMSSYIVPLSLIFVLYLLMLKRLWFGVAPGGRRSAGSLKSKKRVTRMVVVVVVIFAVCCCPIQIVLVLKSVDSDSQTTFRTVVMITSQIVAYMNSCVNPIMYAFMSESFRKAFLKVIACNQRQM